MKRLRTLPRWFKRRIGYARLACLALLIGFAALRVADPAPVEEIRVRTFDAFQRIDPRKKTSRPVTIVDIDDKSLKKLGQWPWPRTRMAELVSEITRLGAVVIGFDAVFPEPDRLNPPLRPTRSATSTRRPARGCGAAEQRRGLRRRHQGFPRRARPIRAAVGNCRRSTRRAGHRARDAGRGPQRFLFDFPGLLRNVPVLEQPPPGAACSRSSPSATASCGGCR